MVVKKKGISVVVGILILLMFIIAIAVPLAIVILSQPTSQEQQVESAQSFKIIAQNQYEDFAPVIPNEGGSPEPPVEFIYAGNGSVFFVLNSNSTPPYPLIIQYLVVFNGSSWITLNITKNGNIYVTEIAKQLPKNGLEINVANANTEYNGNPAIEILLSILPYKNQPYYVVAVTQYGNIIHSA